MEDLSSLLNGLNLGGGSGGGGSGGGSGSSARHNIGRVPELDYFARKLAGHPTPAKWLLPYGKAGDVAPEGLPNVHASRAAYLTAMQAHTALEFQVSRWLLYAPSSCYMNITTCICCACLLADPPRRSRKRTPTALSPGCSVPACQPVPALMHADCCLPCRPRRPVRWRQPRASTRSPPSCGGPLPL